MKFEKLVIQNFLSIGDASVTFEPGLVLINGVNYDMSADGNESNGSGKSSIVDAILWCLFGVLSRGKFKEDDVINKAAGADCAVLVEFVHEGKRWAIRRTRKHSEHGNSLSFWINDEDRTRKSLRETEKELEAHLPFSVQLFRHAVQVGQGMPDRFLDLSETEKQRLLCEIVDMDMFDRALDASKGAIAERKQGIALSDGMVSSIQEQVEKWATELASYKQQLKAYQSQSEESMEGLRAQAETLQIEATRFEESSKEASATLQEYIRQVKELQGEAAKVEVVKDALSEKVSQAHRKMESTIAEGRSIKSQRREIENAPIYCPTCGHAIGREDVSSKLEQLAKKEEVLKGRYRTQKLEYDEFRRREEEAAEKVRSAQKKTSAALQEHGKVSEKAEGFRRRADAKRREREQVLRTLQSYEVQSAKMQEKVRFTKEKLEELKESVIPHSDRSALLKKEMEHWKFWQDAIPNLRASAMEEVLSFLNERLDYYMDVFSSGAMGVRLYQEAYGRGSKIRVELRTPGGTYEMSSGGEKRRVDLALYLSLSDLLQASSGLESNLLVADEICDGLSPSGVKKFLDVLKLKAQNRTTVFVISHNPAVQQTYDFDKVLLVERKNGRASVA